MPTPPEPLVIRTMREYREALEAREMDAMRAMTKQWLNIERRLDADIAALAYEVERRAQAGETVTQQMVWRMERYKVIKAKLADEVKRYNQDYLIGAIETNQRQFGGLGIQASRDAISASYLGVSKSIPYFPVLNRDQIEVMVGFLGNGAPLNTLLKHDYPEALEGLTNALVQGIARGLGPSAVAREMADGMGMGLERAMLIARTEINRTYRTASVMQYRESNVVTGFVRLVKKATACMACLMLDGEKLELASELDDHPRGKCVAVPMVIGVGAPRWQQGPAWFNTLTAGEQRDRMGDEKYKLWKSGAFDLADLSKTAHSDEWGDSPRVASIAELTGGG